MAEEINDDELDDEHVQLKTTEQQTSNEAVECDHDQQPKQQDQQEQNEVQQQQNNESEQQTQQQQQQE